MPLVGMFVERRVSTFPVILLDWMEKGDPASLT
jgi:hypothetical protein